MAYTLVATKRTATGSHARTSGKIPGVVYGAGGASENLTFDYPLLTKLYKEAGESSLIDLKVGGEDMGKVLFQDIQRDPVSDHIIHVDLRRIDMKKTLRAKVELRFVGEAPVVKASGGTLITNVTEVEVECLPKDLVAHIDIDLSALTSFEEVIKIKNVVVPAGVTVISPQSEALVAKVAAPLTEAQLKALEDTTAPAADLTQIKTVKEEKDAVKAKEEAVKTEEKK